MKAIPILTPKETDRFWSKVDRREIHECWLWTACMLSNGYGQFRARGLHKAHRVAWALATGLSTFDPLLHDCDNRACVNPFHLREGTHTENMLDMVSRGRQTLGSKNPKAKLDDRRVVEIFFDGRSNTAIAAEYDISDSTVCLIKQGKTWRHLQLVSPNSQSWTTRATSLSRPSENPR